MCLLEAAMCEKCRSSHFQSELGGVKSLRTGGLKILGLGREGYQFFLGGELLLLGGRSQYPIICHAVTICQHDIIVKFSCHCCISLVKFSYWSKFHVDIITGSRVLQFSFITCQEIWKKEIPSLNFSQQLETGVS